MAKGWWSESPRHAQARKGIKTAKKDITLGTANQTAVKERVSDSIQNDMHSLDKHLRLAATSEHPETIRQHLIDAKAIYHRLSEKVMAHRQKYGELPWWVSQTWHGHEDFTSVGKGSVWKIMNTLESANEQNLRQRQKQLFSAIKLPTEPMRNPGD
jgi:hypothetical protein